MTYALWGMFFAPLTILLHELGHLVTAYAVGYPRPVLHFGSVDPGPSAGVPEAFLGVVALAGPLVTALLSSLGCVSIYTRGVSPITAAFTVAAVSRFAVGVPYTLVTVWVRVRGSQLSPPAFDEYKAGQALGFPGDVLLGASSVLFFAVLWFVDRKMRRGQRAVQWATLLVGTVSGWAIWMLAVGPRLLP